MNKSEQLTDKTKERQVISLETDLTGQRLEDKDGNVTRTNEKGKKTYEKRQEENFSYEKSWKRSEEGLVLKETGQDLPPKGTNRWEIEFSKHDEQGRAHFEHGKTTEHDGEKLGHEWAAQLTYGTLPDGTKVKTRTCFIVKENVDSVPPENKRWVTDIWETAPDGKEKHGRYYDGISPETLKTFNRWNELQTVELNGLAKIAI